MKPAANSADSSSAVPFEEALTRLGTIVEAMEGDDLPLDTLLARFEEGTRLARQCQEQLNAAELKISRLEQTVGGELTTKPFTATEDN